MKRRSTKKDGFVVMLALALGALVMAGSLAILTYKQQLDRDVSFRAAQRAIYIAEDTLRTQVQLQLSSVNTSAYLDQFMANFQTQVAGFSMSVSGTQCKSGSTLAPCTVQVYNCIAPAPLGQACNLDANNKPTVPLAISPPDAWGNTYTSITLHYTGNDLAESHMKIKDTVINFLLPKIFNATTTLTAAETTQLNNCLKLSNPWTSAGCASLLQSNYCPSNPSAALCQKQYPLQCNSSLPIFTGTTQDGYGNQTAVCQPIAYTNPKGTPAANENCSVSSGQWMSSISAAMVPSCQTFPQGIAATNTIQLCNQANGQVAKSYELDAHFGVENLRCVNRGGPYDFMAQTGIWN